MHCSYFEKLLGEYLDGRLSRELAAKLEAHLQGCTACAGKLAALRHALQQIKSLEPVPLPEGFVQRVSAAVHAQAQPRRRANRWQMVRWLAPAFGIMVIGTLAWLGTISRQQGRSQLPAFEGKKVATQSLPTAPPPELEAQAPGAPAPPFPSDTLAKAKTPSAARSAEPASAESGRPAAAGGAPQMPTLRRPAAKLRARPFRFPTEERDGVTWRSPAVAREQPPATHQPNEGLQGPAGPTGSQNHAMGTLEEQPKVEKSEGLGRSGPGAPASTPAAVAGRVESGAQAARTPTAGLESGFSSPARPGAAPAAVKPAVISLRIRAEAGWRGRPTVKLLLHAERATGPITLRLFAPRDWGSHVSRPVWEGELSAGQTKEIPLLHGSGSPAIWKVALSDRSADGVQLAQEFMLFVPGRLLPADSPVSAEYRSSSAESALAILSETGGLVILTPMPLTGYIGAVRFNKVPATIAAQTIADILGLHIESSGSAVTLLR